ncbi:MAG: hypothetical protein JNK82_35985 [Myxococcaceae bacterium]|nr:hypothetical protein [Myxococcaceae bacterium]
MTALITPRLHLRLIREAVPELCKLNGKAVAKLALELALKVPLHDALAQAIGKLAEPGELTGEQVERIAGLSMKLIVDGLRLDDAVSVALHEPAHLKPKAPLPEALLNHLFPPNLTGPNVLKEALALNHHGAKMDDAIVAALKKLAGPRAVTPELADAVLAAAQAAFKEGRGAAEAFDLALKRCLPRMSKEIPAVPAAAVAAAAPQATPLP